jgi:hypothetical protein
LGKEREIESRTVFLGWEERERNYHHLIGVVDVEKLSPAHGLFK